MGDGHFIRLEHNMIHAYIPHFLMTAASYSGLSGNCISLHVRSKIFEVHEEAFLPIPASLLALLCPSNTQHTPNSDEDVTELFIIFIGS